MACPFCGSPSKYRAGYISVTILAQDIAIKLEAQFFLCLPIAWAEL
jgi:hypothetical protein